MTQLVGADSREKQRLNYRLIHHISMTPARPGLIRFASNIFQQTEVVGLDKVLVRGQAPSMFLWSRQLFSFNIAGMIPNGGPTL
jgi:hypothetical protein